jgi:hypothetical protein
MNENETVSAERAKAVRLRRLLSYTFLHISLSPPLLPSEQERESVGQTCELQFDQVLIKFID